MLKIIPGTIPTADLHQFMLGAVAPRPIAFASTVSTDGVPNLAPYSFFNAFSSNPPIVIFSSNRKVQGNTTKDTLKNVQDTGEVVINMVSHSIVRQMSLASIEYPPEVNEFEKSGLTPLPSELVKPFRVAESPVQMECKVEQILPLGMEGGAGNLIVCRVVMMHISEQILGEGGRIDPHKIDLMARMGRFYYARASGAAVSEIVQRVDVFGVGFDGLPESLRTSKVLIGNELARLAALPALPTRDEAVAALAGDEEVSKILLGKNPLPKLHRLVRFYLNKNDVQTAAKIGVLVQ